MIEKPTIKVRQAAVADAMAIIAFQKTMAMETEGLELDNELVSRGVTTVFDDPSKGRYYVASDNDIVVASLMITYEWSDWRNANVWWFQSVYVVPEYRRSGIFRKMYEFIRAECEKEGVAGLRLYVETANFRAQKTYEALGMNGSHYKTYEWMRGKY